MTDVWTDRDLPVLRYLVENFDDVEVRGLEIHDIVDGTEFAEDAVKRAMRNLDEADPPYLRSVQTAEAIWPTSVHGVTERARRAVGAWPTPEAFVDRLVAALNAAADAEPDPERKSRIRQAAASIGGVVRDVAVQAAGTVVGQGAAGAF